MAAGPQLSHKVAEDLWNRCMEKVQGLPDHHCRVVTMTIKEEEFLLKIPI
jgi:hypothetical protein